MPYASPEVLKNIPYDGFKADIFSLGVVLFTLITGMHGFGLGRETDKYYQYISEKCNSHYHLQCKKCGKLIHLECDEVKSLKKHIIEEHNFEIDSSSPIIGICEKCNK